ncbi:MAG: hypothetical protein PHI44_03535 [Candidatus Ratteibacteria bacterium]|nr:hypothetical protein [Candidatus Ratteibacteria bacterium]HPP30795.1 hypothetical protein [bacterium]
MESVIGKLICPVIGKKSLQDIETGLKMHQNTWYHLGLVKVAKNPFFTLIFGQQE